ncbi:MAG: hypothetical protein FWC79_04210 [Oscillospiraceae bacterium]|nr:hypothetical protein [Oscillospiraceae bacterium]
MLTGTIKKSGTSVITKEEFTILQRTANRIIKEISKEIMQGSIEIKPIYDFKTKRTSCKNCTYSGICGFNNRLNSYAYIGNRTKDIIMEELKEEKSNDI